jgi:membrane protease subunit HflC
MERRWIIPLGFLFVAMVAWNLCTFTVRQWTQAIVVQLGDPQRTYREPGLYFKLPLIQEVLYFDKRLLLYDAAPKELLTKDKQQLVVDTFSRWRIVDPLKYYTTVRDEAGAQSRLDDIIYSNVRENLGRQTIQEIVSTRRATLMQEITKRSNEKAGDFGIEIVDVRIRRADLPEKNEQNVFRRMRAERERLAKKFRAEGEEESRKIRSQAEKEGKIIVAEAMKKAEIIRGGADAQAVKIFADAYGRDLKFFELQRSLSAYEKSIGEGTTLVVSPQSEFFQYLRSIDGDALEKAEPEDRGQTTDPE